MKIKSLIAFLLLGGMTVSGCTFEDGQPWGEVVFQLQPRFDRDGRGDDRLQTSKDYDVALGALKLGMTTIDLNIAGEEGVLSFDPANPPEGYSLCHNGHCHAADGKLVDYEEIDAELALGGGGEVLVGAVDATIDFLNPTEIPVDCGSCEVGRGTLSAVTVRIDHIRIEGTAFDRRLAPRIPEEGLPFSVDIPLLIETSQTLVGESEIGRSAPVGILVPGDIIVHARLLDQIDFANLDGTQIDLLEALETSVSIERFDP